MFSTADLPPRPSSCTQMECPYCFEVCQPEDLTRENWPGHVMQDLMPFVCVYECCPTPNAMYDSYDKWMKHTERYHMGGGWKCHRHPFAMPFENKEDFRQHIIDSHGASPMGDSEFAENYPPCQPLRSCLFCTQYDDEHISEDLHEHIARHLLLLSQVSLPGDFVDLKDVECGSEFDAVSSGNLVESSWLPSICSDTAQTDPFQSSATEDEELSADIREPPLVKHEDGEPDMWMQLGFTGDARHSRQAGSTKPQYNPEMDGVLVPFRLRYISEAQNYQKAGLSGAHVKEFVRSSVQLARSLDTKGQFSTAGAIMKKIMTDCTTQGNSPVSEGYARSTIESMLQGRPSFKYREIRRMLEYDSTDSDTTDSEHTDYTRTDDGSTDGNSNNCSPRHAKRKDTHDTVYSQV
ncbi:hypothetical protein HDV57DRAFT_505991 [Trichoderma longibrachiatum]